MGGTVNCLLDVVPALILAVILLWTNPFLALAWLPLIVSIDFYATTVGAFINLSVPVAAGKTLKQFVQILFIYFGLIPDIAIMAIAIVTGHTAIGAILAAVLNIALGFLFLSLCPRFIDPPEKRSEKGGETRVYAYSQSEMELRLRIARRNFSRLGGGLTLYQAIYLALSIVASAVLTAVRPDWMQTAWMYIVNFVPQYAIALPLSMLLIRTTPVFRIEKKNLPASTMVKAAFICIFLMLAGSLIGQLVNGLLTAVTGKEAANPLEALTANDSLVLRIAFAVVIGPIVEEFIFRKQLISRMRAYGEKLAVISSAILFALFHGNLSQAFYAFLLGLVFGYVYLRSGKLWYSCALHMFINFIGGVVSPTLVEKAGNVAELSMDTFDFAAIAEAITPGLVALGVYELLLIGAALAGLVLFCLNVGRLRFAPAALELPQGKRFKTAWLNAGMILFVLISLTLIVMTILS